MYPANQSSHVSCSSRQPPPVPIYVYICEPCHNIHKITSSPVVELWTLDSQVPGLSPGGSAFFILFASIFKNRRRTRPKKKVDASPVIRQRDEWDLHAAAGKTRLEEEVLVADFVFLWESLSSIK